MKMIIAAVLACGSLLVNTPVVSAGWFRCGCRGNSGVRVTYGCQPVQAAGYPVAAAPQYYTVPAYSCAPSVQATPVVAAPVYTAPVFRPVFLGGVGGCAGGNCPKAR